jgi:hypothetical protein
MLRRQLRREGAAAVPCAGFDVDTATAYVERALLAAAHQTYEMHLAECTSCRQHVTALLMLNAQLAPAPVTVPVPPVMQPLQPSLWSRVIAPFKEWHASFNLNWGLASAGAAMAALLVTFTVYSWRNVTSVQSLQANAAMATTAAVTQPVALADEVTASASAEVPALLLETNTSARARAEAPISAANGLLARSESVVAAPPVLSSPRVAITSTGFTPTGAAPATPMRVIALPEEFVALNGAKVISPTLPASGLFGTSFAGNGGVQGTPVSLNPNGGLMPVRLGAAEPQPTVSSLNMVKDQLERQARQMPLSELAPVDSAKLADREAADKNAKASKNEMSRTREIINLIIRPHPDFGFVARKGTEARMKETEKADAEALAKPLVKRVNGQTFYFERGYWIDENYRKDITLPLVKLTRGTERYQTALIENPMLEEFFQLGQVIVVWKGKVYEVRK